MKFPSQGQFRLPGFSDRPMFGTLIFSRQEGANLALADTLPGADSRAYEVIQGQTASGEYVTLLHAIRTAESFLPIQFRLMKLNSRCSILSHLLVPGG